MNMHDISTANLECGDCPIRHRAVCARCETDELSLLEQIKYYRSFQAGQTIIWSGDRMEFVGSVVSGIASLTQTMEDGRRQMVGLLLPSDFVGRPGRPTAAFDVTATTDVVMCCFRKKPFEELMTTTPHIAQRLLEMTLDELDAAREWMLLLGRKTAREKIASLISIIARRDAALHLRKKTGALSVDLPLTREEMAECLTTPLRSPTDFLAAFDQLEGMAWYIHHTPEGRFYFDRQENLTKLLQSYAQAAPDVQIEALIQKQLTEMFGPVRKTAYDEILPLPKLGEVADEFDSIHTIERALAMGSVDRIIKAEELRPYVIDALERGMAKFAAKA